jgi:hypothetical protein
MILVSSNAASLGTTIVEKLSHVHGNSIQSIEIAPNLAGSVGSLAEIVISSDKYLNDNAAGIVIFTSGTTGKPKGAVLRILFCMCYPFIMSLDWLSIFFLSSWPALALSSKVVASIRNGRGRDGVRVV